MLPSEPSSTTTRGRLSVLLVLLVCIASTGRPSQAQHLENDLSLLHDIDVNQGAPPDDDFEVEIFYKPEGDERVRSPPVEAPTSSGSTTSGDEDVRRLWGVADTEAIVGRLFSYPIPADAFSGNIETYQVKGLPGWLRWDEGRGSVEGVARVADRGHHYVTIRAKGRNGQHAKDVFAINVKEASAKSVREEAGCKGKEDVSILSAVLGTPLHSLTPAARVQIIRAAQRFMGVKEVSLVHAPHDSDPLSEDSAILAGPGSSKTGQGRSGAGHSLVQWTVGCRGEVSRPGQERVEKVERAAKFGDLERALGVPVLGWHVTEVHPKTKRVKREATYSGDEEYYNYDGRNYDIDNYDDYDYYDGEDEEGVSFAAYDTGVVENVVPDSRVVPPLGTPVFPEVSATPRPGDRGGEDVTMLHFTPVLVSTPVYVPVKPTRVVVEASPTVTYQTASPYQPSGPSETPHLEGSMTSQPPIIAETTTPLSQPSPSTLTPTRVVTPGVEVTTEVGTRNFPPRVANRMQKMAWIAGHVYHLSIPRDTFSDLEDGNTRQLKLIFKTAQGDSVGSNSWIQFNAEEQYIYALPLEEDIGRYTFNLEAIDSENRTTTDSILIHVQQPKKARNFNHRFTATFSIQKKFLYGFNHSLDWQIMAVKKIATLYGDATTDLINVRSITQEPIKLTWTNTSLADSRSTECPRQELDALVQVLLEGGEAKRDVKRAFEPEFTLKRIHHHNLGSCQHQPPPHGPHAGEGEEMEPPYNTPPIFRNQIDFLNGTQGMLFRYMVPLDTCYDTEDGDTSRLKMRLLTSDLGPPDNTSWLHFDKFNKEFFGIPLAEDVGKAEYYLECVDSAGAKVNDAIYINVLGRPASRRQPPVEFSLTIADKYSDFMGKPHRKAKLISRIGEAFGDADSHNVEVKNFRMGSVVVTWHNSSLPSQPCPNQEIKQLMNRMVTEDGDLKPEFVEFFANDFNVVAGKVSPTGKCLGADTPTHIQEETHHPPLDDKVQEEDNDYLLNFIIPAVIIAAMLLLAAVIACCLYRRRRYGKMTMADDRTFVSKGIPIIFAEELDDRPDPAKSPVIMKEEKPPLPPPEYQRGTSPASAPTPPASDRRRRPHSGDAPDDAPSYQPPPPFTATNGASRHPRPNMPPTYRKPPTYVPP